MDAPSILRGTLTRIEGRFAQFDADPGAPQHLSRLFLTRWPGDEALVGKRIQVRYHATPSSGLWGFDGEAPPLPPEPERIARCILAPDLYLKMERRQPNGDLHQRNVTDADLAYLNLLPEAQRVLRAATDELLRLTSSYTHRTDRNQAVLADCENLCNRLYIAQQGIKET